MPFDSFCLSWQKDTLEKLPRNHYLVIHKKRKKKITDQFNIGTDFALRQLHPLTTSLCQKEAPMMRGSCL